MNDSAGRLDYAFHGVSFIPEDRTSHVFTQAELGRELKDERCFSWIDIQAETIAPLNEVLAHLGIDLVLTSFYDAPEILPRIVERPDCLACYLYEIDDPEVHLDTARGIKPIESQRMILVLGKDYVITFHRRPFDAVEEIKRTCADSFQLAGKTPGFIAFLFLQRCLYDYAHLNLANDNYLDVLENELARGEDMREDVSIAGRNILTLKKLAASLSIVLTLVGTKRSPFISNESRLSFHDMMQNAIALRATIDSSREMLDGILASAQAEASKATNETARILTIVSALLLPLTVITGIYGMNFEHMPELKWQYGYFGVLGTMLSIVVSLLLLFRKLGWLGGRK